MLNYTCKCGNTRVTSSMGVPECEGCEDCGSNLVMVNLQNVLAFDTPAPHEPAIRYDMLTGEPIQYCKKCLQTIIETTTE